MELSTVRSSTSTTRFFQCQKHRIGAGFQAESEHAQGTDVITASVRELDEVTRQNVQVANRSDEMAFQLQSGAAKLAEVLSSFRLGDDEAVDRLRIEAAAAVLRMTQERENRAQQRQVVVKSDDHTGGVDFF